MSISKLNHLVDLAQIFDELNIMIIKENHGKDMNGQINSLTNEIINQTGEKKYIEIISNLIYSKLTKVNNKLFELMNLAPEDKIKASEIYEWNMKRFQLKRELQLEFGETHLEEIKLK